MYYKFFFIWVVILFASVKMMAQNQDETEDVIYLESGAVIRGQVLEYNPNTTMKVKILGGSVLVYESSEVLKIEKKKKSTKNIPQTIVKEESKLKERGIYHSVMGGTAFPLFGTGGVIGFGSISGLPLGLGVDYAVGYQLHRLFGVGAQIGFFMPNFEAFVPICANFRGYLMKKAPSLYYDVNIGFGMSLSGIGWNGARKGGLHFRPAIGVLFPSKKKGHFSMDLGYIIQLGGVHEFANYAISLRVGVTF